MTVLLLGWKFLYTKKYFYIETRPRLSLAKTVLTYEYLDHWNKFQRKFNQNVKFFTQVNRFEMVVRQTAVMVFLFYSLGLHNTMDHRHHVKAESQKCGYGTWLKTGHKHNLMSTVSLHLMTCQDGFSWGRKFTDNVPMVTDLQYNMC